MTVNTQSTAAKITPELRTLAKSLHPVAIEYCSKRSFADDMRKNVDAIARRLLSGECPLYKDLNKGGERITEPKDYWLSTDEKACAAYYAAQNRELRAAGLKPAAMDDELCPALVANTEAMQVRWKIIDAMAPVIGIDRKQLYGENEDMFFKLVMGLILNA